MTEQDQIAAAAWLDEVDPGWRHRAQLPPTPLTSDEAEAMRADYVRAFRRLVALPHPGAIPASWRLQSGRTDPLTLTEVADLLCRDLGPNSVGRPFTDQDTNTVEVLTVEDVALPGSQVPRTRVHDCGAGDQQCPYCPNDVDRGEDGYLHCIECGWTDNPATVVHFRDEVDKLRDAADAMRAAGNELARIAKRSSNKYSDRANWNDAALAVDAWETVR